MKIMSSSSSSSSGGGSNLRAIVASQKQTLHLFLSHPPTRTPTIVLYVASFGGALHAAVTTYFYLAIGATEVDIGHFGFVMSVGALIGAPLSGWALDRYGPWVPISVTAGACAWGCLWRGLASSLASLRAGAVLLGVGVNMWTVVLGHLVKSFPASMRSEILSGFGVQFTVIQLAGKGVFPLIEYALHHIVGVEDTLLRYRIHMGMCSFFCIFGAFALFFDKKNITKSGGMPISDEGFIATIKYQQKHSDLTDELEEGGTIACADECQDSMQRNDDDGVPSGEMELSAPKQGNDDSFADNSSSSSSFLNEPDVDEPKTTSIGRRITAQRSNHLVTTITLTFALLLQSIATTILAVLWPLLAHDRFDLSASTFGILTFVSSVVSTGAVAAFPVIERSEKVGGRLRCSSYGFGVGSVLCVAFCLCTFSDNWAGVEMEFASSGSDNDGITNNAHDRMEQLHDRKQFALHALSAMAFQAALCFLEPSLKSTLSLVVNSPSASSSSKRSSLGGTIGLLQTLGSIGGMVGNLAGTVLYKLSKDMVSAKDAGYAQGRQSIIRGGALPFVLTAFLMAICSILIWRLEEPAHFTADETKFNTRDMESGCSGGNEEDGVNAESTEDTETGGLSDCCLALRETTYDLKLD